LVSNLVHYLRRRQITGALIVVLNGEINDHRISKQSSCAVADIGPVADRKPLADSVRGWRRGSGDLIRVALVVSPRDQHQKNRSSTDVRKLHTLLSFTVHARPADSDGAGQVADRFGEGQDTSMLLFPKRAVKTVAESLIRHKGHVPILEFVFSGP
jgi:hypothetical protein